MYSKYLLMLKLTYFEKQKSTKTLLDDNPQVVCKFTDHEKEVCKVSEMVHEKTVDAQTRYLL